MHPTLAEIASRLNGAKLQPNGSYKALCPYHFDEHSSLHLGPGWGFHCYGCGKQGHKDELAEYLGIVDKEYFGRRPRKTASTKACLTITAGVIVATYDYRDADDNLVYQVVRYDPKDFRCRRPNRGLTRTIRPWIWNMRGVERILYRLPELLARLDDVVIYVEGEKDADTLHELGLLATTIAGGVQTLRYTSLRCLGGRCVVCIPDRHPVGEEYMDSVRGRLAGCNGKTATLRLPGDCGVPGWDVTDWLEAGHTGEELKRLIKEAME